MADLHDPRIAITGTVQTEGVTMDGHTHESAPKLSGSDAEFRRSCEAFYAEIHLINLVNRLKDLVISGKAGNDLQSIIASHERMHPGFSAAIKSFITEVNLQYDESARCEEQRDLYQRLFTAEQQKTQALIEFNDI